MKKKSINIILTLALMVGLIFAVVFFNNVGVIRFTESIRDLGLSIAFTFCSWFGIENGITPTVTEYSSRLESDTLLKQTDSFFKLFANGDNFITWAKGFGVKIAIIFGAVLVAYLIVKLLGRIIMRIYRRPNNKYNKDTFPLKIYRAIDKRVIIPVINYIKGYLCFVKGHRLVYITWLILLGITFNLAAVIVEISAFIIYFLSAFDMGNFAVQGNKLLIDLSVFLSITPKVVLVVATILVFDKLRTKKALMRLRHFEAKNCGFIRELPIVSMSVGSMGKKKTTLITDMALSQEVMFRQEAFTRLQKADMKFPNFPWICFENEIKACMEYGVIYNLASIKEWIKKKQSRYLKHGDAKLQLYGYDVKRYGDRYNNGLKDEWLFDVLLTYAELYFIYVIESSLIVSNYSVRTDNAMISEGNFPMWLTDFFVGERESSRHSHILDFDVLRLGRKVVENNEKAGSFEFGIIVITEIGKERGNNLELKEVKKGTLETNQKNDLFNSWLKMCRHSATVDNFPFIKVFTDEQRPESWGADARDLCDILCIVTSEKTRIALPFYTLEETFYEWVLNIVTGLYYDLRFYRGDNTLLVYVLRRLAGVIFRRNERVYNLYGYSVLRLEKSRGTQDGKVDKKMYFLSNQKIYNERFSTDCFSDYFNDMASKTKVGLNDYIEYLTEKASVKELKMQNSYFINSIYKGDDEKTA